MKKSIAAGLLAAGLLLGGAGTASAGEWTCQNPAGNEVHGECNGVPLDVVNPGGNVPPGQNK